MARHASSDAVSAARADSPLTSRDPVVTANDDRRAAAAVPDHQAGTAPATTTTMTTRSHDGGRGSSAASRHGRGNSVAAATAAGLPAQHDDDPSNGLNVLASAADSLEPERPTAPATATTPAAAATTTTTASTAPGPPSRPVPPPLTVPPPRAPSSFSSTIGPLAAQREATHGAPHALLPATTTPATAAAPAPRARTPSSLLSTLAPLTAQLEAMRGPPSALLPPPTGAAYGAPPAFPPPTAAGYAPYPGSAPTTAWATTAPAYAAGWAGTAPMQPPPAPARLAVTHAALVQDLTSRSNPCIATSSTDHVWTVSLTDESAASGKRAKPGVASNGAGAAGEAHSGTCDLKLWLLLDAPAQEAAFVEFDVYATLTNVMDVSRPPLVDRGYVLCRATRLVSVHLRFKVALRRLDTYRLDMRLNVNKGNGGEACPVVVRGLPSQITLVSRRTADRRKASFQTPDHAATTSSTDPPATCTPPPPQHPAAKRARLAVAPDTTPPLPPTTTTEPVPPVMSLDTGSAPIARALALMTQPDSPTAEEVARVVGAVGSANRVARMGMLERWITRQVQEYSDGKRGGWSEPVMRAVVSAVGSDLWDPDLWLNRPLAFHGTQFPLHAVVSPARMLPPPSPRPANSADPSPLFAMILAVIDVDTLCAALAARNATGSTPAVLAARHPNPAVPAAFFSVLATHVAIGPVLTTKDAAGECAASVLARRGADGVRVVDAVVEAVRGVRGGIKAVLHGMREYVEGRAEVWGEVCVRMMDTVAREEGVGGMEMAMRDESV